MTASVGGFVPKAQTPFQWYGQDTIEELARKVILLRNAARGVRGLTLRWHDPEATAVEGIASRGDRRIGAVIERVWRAGGTFQEWTERFDLGLWQEALDAEGLSLDSVVYRDRDEHEALPWDHLSAGLHRDFLWSDWQDALAGTGVEDCRWTPCYDCGACTEYGVEHVVASRGAPGRRQPGDRPGPERRRPGARPLRHRRRRGPLAVPDAVRFRFAKLGKVRFTSHRDLARMWERAPAPQRPAAGLVPGLLAPPLHQLRPRPADRLRVGRRVPRRPPARAGGRRLGAGRGGRAGRGGDRGALCPAVVAPARRGRRDCGAGRGGWRGLAAARSNIVFLGVGGARFGCRGASGEGRAVSRRSERPRAA